MTDFSNQCRILAELYKHYEEDFPDFMYNNDWGVHFAYFISEGMCEKNNQNTPYVEQTWKRFLDEMNLEDIGFLELKEVFAEADFEVGMEL